MQVAMEDSIDVIVEEHSGVLSPPPPQTPPRRLSLPRCSAHSWVWSGEHLHSAWPWYHPQETQGIGDSLFFVPNFLRKKKKGKKVSECEIYIYIYAYF